MSNPTPNPLSACPPVLSRFHFLRPPASPSFRSEGGASRFVSKQWFLTESFQMSVTQHLAVSTRYRNRARCLSVP
jgi:hypothetical protein